MKVIFSLVTLFLLMVTSNISYGHNMWGTGYHAGAQASSPGVRDARDELAELEEQRKSLKEKIKDLEADKDSLMKKQENYKRDIRRVLKTQTYDGVGVAQAVIDHIVNQTDVKDKEKRQLYHPENKRDSDAVCNSGSSIAEPWPGFCPATGTPSSEALEFHIQLRIGTGLIDRSICAHNLRFVTTKDDIDKKDTDSVNDLKRACMKAIYELPNLVDNLNEKIRELEDKELEDSYLKDKIEDAKDDLK